MVDLAGTGCMRDLSCGQRIILVKLGHLANNLIVNGDNLPAMRVRYSGCGRLSGSAARRGWIY